MTTMATTGELNGKTVTKLATGVTHTLLLTSDGKVYAFGANNYGQLGDGTNTNRYTPVAVNMSDAIFGKVVVDISAGDNHNLALTSDGRVYSWGRNNLGQLGDETSGTTRNVPYLVGGLLSTKNITSISCGSTFSMVITSDGEIFGFGDGSNGKLGDGANTNRNTPSPVDRTGVLANKTSVSVYAGGSHTLVIANDSRVYSWGLNSQGQIGDNTMDTRSSPVAIEPSFNKPVVAVSAGNSHSLVLTSDGQVYSFGLNDEGQLGDGTTTSRISPVPVLTTGVLSGKSINAISAHGDVSIVLASGKVYTFGSNSREQLGGGTKTSRHQPIASDVKELLQAKLLLPLMVLTTPWA